MSQRYVVKHTANPKGRWGLFMLWVGVQQLEFLVFFFLFKDFAFYYLSARTPKRQNSLL